MIKLKKSLYFLIFFNSVLVSKNYYEKFDEALQLYKDGRYRLSEEYFRKIISCRVKFFFIKTNFDFNLLWINY